MRNRLSLIHRTRRVIRVKTKEKSMIRLSRDLGFIRSCKKSKGFRKKPKRKLKRHRGKQSKSQHF